MIVKIETEIIGSFTIENEMAVRQHPYEINIRFDQETSRYLISISKRETNYSRYLPKLELNEDKLTGIVFPSQEFLHEQIQILKHIESFGALDKNIERINWQNCTLEWIPETEGEKEVLTISSYHRNLEYKTETKILSQQWLFQTVVHRKQLENLDLPFAFIREGTNFFHKFQFQNSFINFYLMLEGVFSNGKHYKSEDIKQDFKKSEILKFAITEAIKYLERSNEKHFDWLKETCKAYNKNVDIEGIIHLLVEQRGSLSHFSLASRRKQKNLFKDKDYESLAFLAMVICLNASIKLRLEPFKRK